MIRGGKFDVMTLSVSKIVPAMSSFSHRFDIIDTLLMQVDKVKQFSSQCVNMILLLKSSANTPTMGKLPNIGARINPCNVHRKQGHSSPSNVFCIFFHLEQNAQAIFQNIPWSSHNIHTEVCFQAIFPLATVQGGRLDRSQSDFYFVPQEICNMSHSQAGSTREDPAVWIYGCGYVDMDMDMNESLLI